LRIAAAAAVGIILLGILAWPLVAPADPIGAVYLNSINTTDAITLIGLAVLAGLLAYFLTQPYGLEIGVLAVPAGLALWAVRTGNMASIIQLNPTPDYRQQLFEMLRWEPFFWLALVAAGFVGVILGYKIQPKTNPSQFEEKTKSEQNMYLNGVIALVSSFFIVQLCIRILAQDIRAFDSKLGSVVGQPAIGQIIFAVLVSFGIAAFVVKKFLNLSYIWPIAAGALVTTFAVNLSLKQNILQHLCQRWPAVFFASAVTSILPVQMVAFGVLGSIAGYWLAVRYNYWENTYKKAN
jgi:hypothetical protein